MRQHDSISPERSLSFSGRVSTSTIIAGLLAVLLVREQVQKIPRWIKRYAVEGWELMRLKSIEGLTEEISFGRDLNRESTIVVGPLNIAQKLSDLLTLASAHLTTALDGIQMNMALVTMMFLVGEIREKEPDTWDKLHEDSGKPIALSFKTRQHLIQMLRLADWAYLEETDEIRSMLSSLGNTHLIRHVKLDSPGQVCHFISMDTKNKIIYISVRGTWALADAVTDACGTPQEYQLSGTFQKDVPRTITCHSGILDASINLVDDIEPIVEHVFLPSGFKIMLVGHSLGAGVASVAGIILRSRLPQLQVRDKEALEVLAFAPPPVLNYNAANAAASFTTSIVNNFDIIPRVSIWTLAACKSLLEYVNEKVEEKGLSSKGTKEAFQLMLKLNDGIVNTILTTSDLMHGLDVARKKFDHTDTNYLFVPGEIIVMYQKMGKTIVTGEPISTTSNAPVAAIMTTGLAKVLGNLFVDPRIFSDHATSAYEATLSASWDE